jgi:hypothetical protein
MSEVDLAKLLHDISNGEKIMLPPGEYKGPFHIDRPVKISGSGPSTVLWAPQGPVVKVQAANVFLECLSIEVTEDHSKPALKLEGNNQAQFNQIRVLGGVEGLPAGQNWDVPETIDFGELIPGRKAEKMVGIRLPGSGTLSSNCAGLHVISKSTPGGPTTLRLEFEEDHLVPGMLIDGLLEITCLGINTLIRLTGEVQAVSNTVAGRRNRVEAINGDIFQGIGANKAPIPIQTKEEEHPFEQEENAWLPQPISDKPSRTIDTFLERVEKAELAREFDRAQQILEDALMLYPQDIRLRSAAAMFFERIGDFPNAASEWEIIHSIDHTYPQVLTHLAKAYTQTNRSDQTISLLEKELELGQQTAEIYRNLAMAYHKSGRVSEAVWAMEKAQEISFDPKLKALINMWRKQLLD